MNKSKIISTQWDHENNFHLASDPSRLKKIINHYEIFKLSKDVKGDILEFGVFKGNSLIRFLTYNSLISNSKKKIYGFDTFSKFPISGDNDDIEFIKVFEKDSGSSISKKDLDYFLKRKKFKNYKLIEGDIFKTLPNFIKNHNIKISFLHIDVDIYEPTLMILENLFNKINKNGILLLDDYKIIKGETRAVDDFFLKNNIKKNFETIKKFGPPYFYIKK